MKPPGPDHDETPDDFDLIDDTIDDPLRPHSFLSLVSPFKHLDEEVLTLLHSSMTQMTFESGELLMRQGDPGTSLMVLAAGKAEVSVDGEDRSHVLKHARTGEVLGEMALLTGEPRSANVTAIKPIRAWVLPADKFHELAARNPKISALLTLLLSSRLGRARHDALTGKIFHGYRIRRRLGRGGMSVVYEAEDATENRRVALKMMSHRLIYDPKAMRQFQHEAEIIESLDHPNIAKIYGKFEAFRTFFMVMEFCEGISADSAISTLGRIPEPVVRQMLGQLSMALAHAHGAGIVHRDIKPSNIMITRDGSVKLIDFGLAQRRDDPSTGLLFGTPRYMAPEQMSGGPVGKRTDLFALGSVLYEMLSGQPLFASKKLWSLRKEVLRCRIPDLDSSLPEVGPDLRRALEGMLVCSHERRELDFDQVGSWASPVDFSVFERPG